MKKPCVAILHYSAPPVIGGVEFIIAAHAKLLADYGCEVRLIVGRGEGNDSRVDVAVIPEISSEGGSIADVLRGLAQGERPGAFEGAVKRVEKQLRAALDGVDVCMLHNVLTMHFNLVLTAALARIMLDVKTPRFIGWTHDLTFTDPNYEAHQRDEYPWNLLKQALPGCRYCAISAQRQKEVKKLFGVTARDVPIIPDGIDIRELIGLTHAVTELFQGQQLYLKDFVALTPTRIVRRKNLEAGMEIVAGLKRLGKTVRWMITGAPDPHNPDSVKYYEELMVARRKLNLEKDVIFLCECFPNGVSNEDLRGLYGISNMLLFPSEREGFGIPVLEAGMTGLLVVISDIPALRELGGSDTVYIYPGETPDAVACRILRAYRRSPRLVFQKKIVSNYSWDAIFNQKILPAVTRPGALWKAPRK